MTAMQNARYTRSKQRTPAWADLDAIRRVYAAAAALTRVTGMEYEVDHVLPLQGRKVSGLHVQENLQILMATQNRQKWNHFEPE